MPHLGNKHAWITVTYLSFHKLLCLWNVCATDMAWSGVSPLFIIFLQQYADLCLSKAIVFPRQKRDQSDLVFFSLANLTVPSERSQLELSFKEHMWLLVHTGKSRKWKRLWPAYFFFFFIKIWAHNQFLIPLAHCHTSQLVLWTNRMQMNVCPPVTFIALQISKTLSSPGALSLTWRGWRW